MTLDLNTPYVFYPRPNLICAGQPDPQGLREAAESGVRAVANLRPDAEMDFDEAALMEELELDYLSLPVAGPDDLNETHARRLLEWLEQHEGSPVLVHCASSNRVGALLALAAGLTGADAKTALELGRAAGLTRMEPFVQTLLQQWGR